MLINGTGPRKVMGDPGTTESFALPNYVYIIVMKKTGESTWERWRVITKSGIADEEKWTKRRYYGSLQTAGDSIYEYNEEFSELLDPGELNFSGRVYAVASSVELTFNKNPLTTIDDLSDVENLTFNSSSVQANIQDIYTTPYNYIVDGEYYGSFNSTQKVPHVFLMLYHVAAKVDITWSVADSARVKAAGVTPIRLTQMDACNLFNGNAFCFKPMENVYDSDDPLASGAEVNIVTSSDEGLWWEGRSYFYTIPYTTTKSDYESYFPLQMQMETNGSGNIYTPTIYMQIDKSSPFVPWLRATFNLKKELTAGTDTKTVNLPTP